MSVRRAVFWSDADIETLRRLWTGGVLSDEIAKGLGRTGEAVRSMAWKLNLPRRAVGARKSASRVWDKQFRRAYNRARNARNRDDLAKVRAAAEHRPQCVAPSGLNWPINCHASWSRRDDRHLIRLNGFGLSRTEIALVLQRTERAVVQRFRVLTGRSKERRPPRKLEELRLAA
jgi:hypothetical protein